MYSVRHSRSSTCCTRQLTFISATMTTPQDGAGVSNSQVPDLQSAVSKAVADSMSTLSAQISLLTDVRFENFKTQLSQENSASVEAAVKGAKRDRYVFQRKGNEQQFEHAESVLENWRPRKMLLTATPSPRRRVPSKNV